MTPYEELFQIADRLEKAADSKALTEAEDELTGIEAVVGRAEKAFSGSSLGYHAFVYYRDLNPPPPGAHFSSEWGLKRLLGSLGTQGDWIEHDPDEISKWLQDEAGNPDLASVKEASDEVLALFETHKSEACSILHIENADLSDTFLKALFDELENLQPLNTLQFARQFAPNPQMTRDEIAVGQGYKIPPHIQLKAEISSIRYAFRICKLASDICRKAASHIERQSKQKVKMDRVGTNVFIGHGRSGAWRELKDFVFDRLKLPWDEFNRVPVAGITNHARLVEMLDAAAVAFLIMTAEDETAEGEMQARMNVIHEVGLFQGRLGFTKAIVLLEEGCQEFSNIQGLGQIRFPKGNIAACFEEVRQVLEREGVLDAE